MVYTGNYQPREGKTMKLHSDKITSADIYAAARRAGVSVNELTEHGSRSHGKAYSVYLEGSSSRQSNQRDHKAATWDEWGMVMADLYRIDPDAMWGSVRWGYTDEADFHLKTQNRFTNGMPYDYKHSMPLSDVAFHYCTGCTARTRRG
jgi:hypothetical protein